MERFVSRFNRSQDAKSKTLIVDDVTQALRAHNRRLAFDIMVKDPPGEDHETDEEAASDHELTPSYIEDSPVSSAENVEESEQGSTTEDEADVWPLPDPEPITGPHILTIPYDGTELEKEKVLADFLGTPQPKEPDEAAELDVEASLPRSETLFSRITRKRVPRLRESYGNAD